LLLVLQQALCHPRTTRCPYRRQCRRTATCRTSEQTTL